MKENLPLRFLYNTALGRGFLKLFIMPGISKIGGAFLNTRCSKFFIGPFMRKNHITLEGIEIGRKGFSSFNEFFKRKRKSDAIVIDQDSNHFISPCDAYFSVFEVGEDSVFQIKGVDYSLKNLLRERKLGERYHGGKVLIFRLTPTHYHRYSFVETGKIVFEKRIDGALHCVRPIAMERYPIFIQNSREFVVIDTKHFGRLVQMEVGALMVGKIKNHMHGGRAIRGEEKGCFEFGGSTILVLVEKDKLKLREELLEELKSHEEVNVTIGEWIGMR